MASWQLSRFIDWKAVKRERRIPKIHKDLIWHIIKRLGRRAYTVAKTCIAADARSVTWEFEIRCNASGRERKHMLEIPTVLVTRATSLEGLGAYYGDQIHREFWDGHTP